MMKLLLHTCCAPCAVQCVKALRDEGTEPVAFFYNPNIHPFTEYRSRKQALVDYAKSIDLALVVHGEYGLREFLSGIPHMGDRCGFCYAQRLEATAAYAAQNGFDAFTTTLLISPYQNYDLICQTGEQAAQKWGVSFVPRDFRPLFRDGQQQSRELGLYMQKYCGCIFSEEERYAKKR